MHKTAGLAYGGCRSYKRFIRGENCVRKNDNELLTRVGRGTRMGEHMRRYWLPALLTEKSLRLTVLRCECVSRAKTCLHSGNSTGRVGLLGDCAAETAAVFLLGPHSLFLPK